MHRTMLRASCNDFTAGLLEEVGMRPFSTRFFVRTTGSMANTLDLPNLSAWKKAGGTNSRRQGGCSSGRG